MDEFVYRGTTNIAAAPRQRFARRMKTLYLAGTLPANVKLSPNVIVWRHDKSLITEDVVGLVARADAVAIFDGGDQRVHAAALALQKPTFVIGHAEQINAWLDA